MGSGAELPGREDGDGRRRGPGAHQGGGRSRAGVCRCRLCVPPVGRHSGWPRDIRAAETEMADCRAPDKAEYRQHGRDVSLAVVGKSDGSEYNGLR